MLKVVSFNFDKNPEEHRLVESCKHFGYDLEFIGQGEGFKDFRQAKIDLLIREIAKVKEEHVMYTDGLDSWFLRGDILERFKEFKMPVVVSANRDDYPTSNLYAHSEYPEAPTSFRYICSSQFIGKTKSVLEALIRMERFYKGYIDQEGWNYGHVKGLFHAEVDHECKLFLNMTRVKLDELSPEFVLKETNIMPASIHFGGPKGDDPNNANMVKTFERWKGSL